jgi:hypothetical protein
MAWNGKAINRKKFQIKKFQIPKAIRQYSNKKIPKCYTRFLFPVPQSADRQSFGIWDLKLWDF